MDLFNVVFAPRADKQLEEYVTYIQYVLLNEGAARRVYNDALETLGQLAKVASALRYCEHPTLKRHGYRLIHFRRHQYVMLYRVEGKTAYVDAVFHQRQDKWYSVPLYFCFCSCQSHWRDIF